MRVAPSRPTFLKRTRYPCDLDPGEKQVSAAWSDLGLDARSRPNQVLGAELRTDNPIAHLGLAWTDDLRWTRVVDITAWQAQKWEQRRLALVTRFHAGMDVPGRPVRYLKFETRGETPRPMLLQRVEVYGE